MRRILLSTIKILISAALLYLALRKANFSDLASRIDVASLGWIALAIAFLSEREAVKQINNTWNAKGENVAELLSYMIKEGLEFAPAAEGDEAAYTALYQALRDFEAGIPRASR